MARHSSLTNNRVFIKSLHISLFYSYLSSTGLSKGTFISLSEGAIKNSIYLNNTNNTIKTAIISSTITIYFNARIPCPLFARKPLVNLKEIADITNGNVKPEKLG